MNVHDIKTDMRRALEKFVPHGELRDICDYVLFPTGKLFRAKMVLAQALDAESLSDNHRLFATSIEFHHAYTLVHDDLPCMDNSDERRGRPSVHRKFNEWKALLVGDGLLNVSYRILGDINHPRSQTILKIFSHTLGPKGLILGQYKDLCQNTKFHEDEILNISELKTARLFQCALVGSYLLCERVSYRQALNFMRLGRAVGIVFQLLDDLVDSDDSTLNPWKQFFNRCFEEYRISLSFIYKNVDNKQHLKAVLTEMFHRLSVLLVQQREAIEKTIDNDLTPLFSLLRK